MGKAKILVADDDPDTLDVSATLLEMDGYDVVRASSGKEGLRLVRQELPDLALLDVLMPDIDGIEVCRQIKSDPALAGVLVIHVSGMRTRAEDQAGGLDAGADGYLSKPVDPRVLLAHVRALIRTKRAETALDAKRANDAELAWRLTPGSKAQVAADQFGLGSVESTYPDIFKELLDVYLRLLDQALERRIYKVEPRISDELRSIADRLGFLRAGPRDVVDLHTAAIRMKTTDIHHRKADVLVEEGRLLLLELMGNLVSYYRIRSLGSGWSGASTGATRNGRTADSNG